MSDSGKFYARDDIGGNDFWDLSANKGNSRPAPSYQIHKQPTPEGVLIESGTGGGSVSASVKIPDRKPEALAPDTILEYTPDNIFINKVKITTKDKNKNIFEPSALFMRERAALLERKGTPCSYVSFYSHSPRYSSMTRAQLSYYLWWRENVRNGEFIKTDISYIKLYIQELVTAGEGEDLRRCLTDLVKIALTCFDNVVGKIYIARIISDFCLIHKFKCPIEEIRDVLHTFMADHSADEFFLGLSESNRHIYAPIAIEHISIYDYKKSKFYTDEKKATFDTHIHAALNACFINDASYGEIINNASGIFSTKLTDRKLFDGRIEFCAPNTRILVSYFPVKCIAGVVTDAIRYAENKLRALLGIRTSLAVGELPFKITDVIDGYFASVSDEFASAKASEKQKAEQKLEEKYSHLYDIPKTQLSLSNAKAIEARSWATTKKLTEAFAESAECRVQSAELKSNEDFCLGQKSTSTLNSSLLTLNSPSWGEHHEFLLICKSGSPQEQKSYARSHGMTLDGLADIINELAVNIIGDIILDFDGEKYTVIEDYTDLI